MHWYNWFLFPFSILFDLITRSRNWFFDKGFFKVTRAHIPSILVGNLRVGGTGKTPMVEYLIRILDQEFKIGTLSRGYGRASKGFKIADEHANPSIIGDEPFQIYSKFGDKISVFVGENRVAAFREITKTGKVPEIVILDDAFQHRAIKADLNILLTTYYEPFFDDYLLPAGRLRESRKGANRADLVVVTKCPDQVSEGMKNEFIDRVRYYSGDKIPVLFSKINYGQPYAIGRKVDFSSIDAVILVSGLANDALFVNYARLNFHVVEILSFSDHHAYLESDFAKLKNVKLAVPEREIGLLTTEKDAEKLKSKLEQGFLQEIPIFALPILVEFSTEDEKILKDKIQQKVLKKSQN
jgi:tetraacyldisaccharide 4'-kinase